MNQGKPTKSALSPTIESFTSSRPIDPSISNGFSNFMFGQMDPNPQRSEASVGSWGDAASVHSPSDDRRSVAASDFFGSSSAAPSRSGSLPPSRHGEPAQLPQYGDQYSRYVQANPRQHSSFSHANGRPFQERSGSIQSESLQMLERLHLEQDHEFPVAHRSSASINGSAFVTAGNEAQYSRGTYVDSSALARLDETTYRGTAGTYTPDTYNNSNNNNQNDPHAQFTAFPFDSRSAPNGTVARQSPMHSHTNTPPVFDYLYPSRSNQTLSNGNNIDLVQRKLEGVQQQQERPNFMNPSHFHQQQFQHLLAPQQIRSPYGYAYGLSNGLPVNAITPTIPMSMIPQVVAVLEPPKAPREHIQSPETFMSKALFEYRANSKNNNRRFELKDIYDHVVEFSGDQHGSRFIQGKLESANSDEKDRVFKELQSDSLQLMQDVFGNYVIQKFFEHGDQTQKRILANRMKGHVLSLSLQMYGCRVVQKALEHVLTDQQAVLIKELEKDVIRCVRDQNGNHVIQKAIERVPLEHIQFIVDAFKNQVGSLTIHGYGCRVIQRLLEFVPDPARRPILDELHAEGSKFFTDQYGNYVAQHMIQHGTVEDRATVIELVTNDFLTFSKNKFTSNVVERCLIFGTDAQRQAIVNKVIEKNERGESNLMMLLRDNFGNYVIQKILDTICRQDYEKLVSHLKPEMDFAKKSISGKHIIQVEKRMHRFDRVDSVSSPTTQRSSMSSTADDADVPALTSEAQSPQSSSLPSANTSTIDEPVHTPLTADKKLTAPGVVSISNTS